MHLLSRPCPRFDLGPKSVAWLLRAQGKLGREVSSRRVVSQRPPPSFASLRPCPAFSSPLRWATTLQPPAIFLSPLPRSSGSGRASLSRGLRLLPTCSSISSAQLGCPLFETNLVICVVLIYRRIRPARSATARLTGPTRTDASSSFAPTFPSAGGSSHPPPAQPSFAAKAPSPPAPAPKPVQVDSPRTRRRKAVFGDDAVAPLPKAEPSLLYARAQHEPVPSSSKLPPAAPPAPRPSTARPTSTMSTAHVSAAKARSDLTRAVSPPRRPGATAPARESERPSTSAATTESKKRPWEAGNSE